MTLDVGALDFEDHCWRDVVAQDALDIYAPYRRDVGLRGSVTLLAIDLFAGVFPARAEPTIESIRQNSRSCGEAAWDAIPRIQSLIAEARSRRWPVLFTTSALLAPKPSVDASLRATLRSRPEHGRGDLDDYKIDPRFNVEADDEIVYKSRASAFFGTQLDDQLRKHNTETLLICGESTSGCVRATAVDAYSHGFHVAIVEECVFDRHLLSHKINLFDLHHKYADVLRLREVVSLDEQ